MAHPHMPPEPPQLLQGRLLRELEKITADRRRMRLREWQITSQLREGGVSWDTIGAALGVNGETIRRRYGRDRPWD